MSAPDNYSATERLRDGREVEIRALRPDDKDDMLAAVGRTGMQSLQRRFFVVKRGFSDKEIAYFMNIDFANHVALAALAEEDGRKLIIGGGRYIVTDPGKAEIAFVVIDDYQGQGLGRTMLGRLAAAALQRGVARLRALIVPDNAPVLGMLRKYAPAARFTYDGEIYTADIPVPQLAMALPAAA